jgi:hypothetical protein
MATCWCSTWLARAARPGTMARPAAPTWCPPAGSSASAPGLGDDYRRVRSFAALGNSGFSSGADPALVTGPVPDTQQLSVGHRFEQRAPSLSTMAKTLRKSSRPIGASSGTLPRMLLDGRFVHHPNVRTCRDDVSSCRRTAGDVLAPWQGAAVGPVVLRSPPRPAAGGRARRDQSARTSPARP